MYCTLECKAAAKKERRDKREEQEKSDLHLPHLVDLSNQELQDLLPLRKIGEQCKFETDRVLRFMHDNSPVDLLMPDGWKAAPWIYYVRERLIEVFAQEGLTLGEPSSYAPKESSISRVKLKAGAKSRLYHPEDIRAKAVRLYTEGRTAREVVEVLKVPVPISTVHKWLHDAGVSRSPAEAWRNRLMGANETAVVTLLSIFVLTILKRFVAFQDTA